MLTEDQKSQIRAEEYFKYEVRKSLEQKKNSTFLQRCWMFLNSSFGLWLLSSVVVGLIVNSYSNHEKNVAVQVQNQETQRKIETEISSRVQSFQIELKRILLSKEFYSGLLKSTAFSVDAGASKLGGENPINVFPEFESRSLQSLIVELEQLFKDENEKSQLKQAIIIMNNIKHSLATLPESYKGPEGLYPGDEIAKSETLTAQAKSYREEFERNSLVYQKKITQALELLNTNYYLKKWINI
jgi:hypothetical protein